MSDSAGSPSPQPRRKKTRPASEDGGRTATAKRRKVARKRRTGPPPLIQVNPEDAKRDKSVVAVLKGEARTGVPGLLVSVGLHGVVLIVMAIIVIELERADATTLEFGWISSASPFTAAAGQQPGPVRLQSFNLNRKGAEPVTGETQADQSTGRKKPGVKPVDVMKSLVNRNEDARASALESMGEKDTVRQAIDRALGWFKRQQRGAGNWKLEEGYPDPGYRPSRTDTGATALALLCFLGNGHTHTDGPYATEVNKGLRWLKGVQKPNGDLHDWDEFGRQSAFYAHSMATIAICEAYAMTQDRELLETAERAVQFLLDSQQPVQGGWKYNPQGPDTMGDLSVTGWALMALHSARMADIDVPDTAFGLTSVFIDACAVDDGARYRYEPKDVISKVTPAMTASGLLARQWLGWERDDPFMAEGVDWLLQDKFKPEWTTGRRNTYEWYYIAQVLHNLGGDQWKDWYAQAAREVCRYQKTRGSRKPPTDIMGSWAPLEFPGADAEHSHIGGRLYLTALCVLVLETPYRHAPLYSPPPAETETVKPEEAPLSE